MRLSMDFIRWNPGLICASKSRFNWMASSSCFLAQLRVHLLHHLIHLFQVIFVKPHQLAVRVVQLVQLPRSVSIAVSSRIGANLGRIFARRSASFP